MSEYHPVRASQVQFFKTVPFYYQVSEGEFRLYKKDGERLTRNRTREKRHPQLFIHDKDREQALKELIRGLNVEFAQKLSQGGLVEIKTALGDIVREALTPGQEAVMLALPETLDIIFHNMNNDHTTMEYLVRIAGTSNLVVEHTVNVTALTLQYCFFLRLPETQTANLALCALLHDVGIVKLEKDLVEAKTRLNDRDFNRYKTHTEAGHDLIILNTDFDVSVATVALEHHERLDKSGYPNGINTLGEESQLIGLIDSYEALTYRETPFRRAKTPFDTLRLIKNEVIAGKFSKTLFKAFTSCLTK